MRLITLLLVVSTQAFGTESEVTDQGFFLLKDDYGIEVYSPEDVSMEEYFQNRSVLISRFRLGPEEIVDTSGGGKPGFGIILDYPSVNREGMSPIYSHPARVLVSQAIPVALEDVNRFENALVLLPTEDILIYELVGFARLRDIQAFDYFKAMPEYNRPKKKEE